MVAWVAAVWGNPAGFNLMVMSDNDFSQVCLKLRNAAPDQWREFTNAFSVYDYQMTLTVTTAPPDRIMNTQGRAQVCQALMRIFNECDAPPGAPSNTP